MFDFQKEGSQNFEALPWRVDCVGRLNLLQVLPQLIWTGRIRCDYGISPPRKDSWNTRTFVSRSNRTTKSAMVIKRLYFSYLVTPEMSPAQGLITIMSQNKGCTVDVNNSRFLHRMKEYILSLWALHSLIHPRKPDIRCGWWMGRGKTAALSSKAFVWDQRRREGALPHLKWKPGHGSFLIEFEGLRVRPNIAFEARVRF